MKKFMLLIVMNALAINNLFATTMLGKELNEFAIDGYRGVFNGSNVEVDVPNGTYLTSQKATFNSDDLLVNGQKAYSNETITDFTRPEIYDLVDGNNVTTQEYKVEVKLKDKKNIPSASSTMHANDFYFVLGKDVNGLKLDYENSMVTSGQRADANFDINKIENDALHIMFESGKKKSDAVASAFKDKLGQNCGAMLAPDNKAVCKVPAELHFFITANMYINNSRVTNKVYIAQGSNLFGTNWWFGTKATTTKVHFGNDDIALKVATEDGKIYYIIRKSSGSVNKLIIASDFH